MLTFNSRFYSGCPLRVFCGHPSVCPPISGSRISKQFRDGYLFFMSDKGCTPVKVWRCISVGGLQVWLVSLDSVSPSPPL